MKSVNNLVIKTEQANYKEGKWQTDFMGEHKLRNEKKNIT